MPLETYTDLIKSFQMVTLIFHAYSGCRYTNLSILLFIIKETAKIYLMIFSIMAFRTFCFTLDYMLLSRMSDFILNQLFKLCFTTKLVMMQSNFGECVTGTTALGFILTITLFLHSQHKPTASLIHTLMHTLKFLRVHTLYALSHIINTTAIKLLRGFSL